MVLHDEQMREPLFEYLDEIYGKNRILEEKNMGRSRADVVMVTEDAIYGIEIKSDADTYARLPGQIKDYDTFYDFNLAVVGSSHAKHIKEHVPQYWGIITVEWVGDVLDFYMLRKPLRNPKVTWKRKLEILWRPELAVIQEKNQMPKYKEKSKAFVIEKLVARLEQGKIDEEILTRQVSECLFERDYSTIAEDLLAYRKGEIAKKLEVETDPKKQFSLILQREKAKANLKKKARVRRKRMK